MGKKSWMTETSGEDPAWISPSSGYPNAGAFSIAVKLHQALTAGRQSAWAYWQLTDGSANGASTLTDAAARAGAPKYVAAKHFFSVLRPGAVRVNASVDPTAPTPLLASGYVQDADYSLAVVLVNPSAGTVHATVQVPAYPAALSSFQVYVSSNGSYWQNSVVVPSGGRASLTVPGYGVATLYGIGLNANASSAVGIPAVSVAADGHLQIVFRRDAARAELSYAVQASSDLAAGNWTTIATSTGGGAFVSTGAVSVTEMGGGSTKTVTVEDAPSGGSLQRFLRVRVTN